METPARQSHVLRDSGSIQPRKLQAQPLRVVWPDPVPTSGQEEAFDAPVPEGLDHAQKRIVTLYTCQIQRRQLQATWYYGFGPV